MRVTKIETENGKTVITTETPRWLWFLKPRVQRFVAARRIVGDFWEWLELPDKRLVTDQSSYQLDAWKREGL
jgi:hypothetical protein